MLRLGNSLQDVLFNYAWDGLTYTVMSRTMLGALYAGLWPLGLIKLASVLDNPFSVALARADKAGKVLAHALIDGVQGKRPVTLMGYSVGARVIYACLLELAEQHAFGLVESVVLMGAPAPSDSTQWTQIRSVVAARVVNIYSTEDYVLGYLYRSTKLEFGVAGLDAVKGIHGIENVDMSKLVSGHDRYRYLAGKILVNIGFGDINFDKVNEQERALEMAEREKQRAKEQAKKTKSENETADTFTEGSTKPQSPSLIDVSEEPKPSRTPTSQQTSRPRPAMYTQSNSRQQPMRHKSLVADAPASKSPQSSPEVSIPDSDPLGATSLIDTASPTIRQPSFPTASALSQRQMPSTLVSDPAAQLRPVRSPASAPTNGRSESNGPIGLIDMTAPIAPSKADNNVTKTAPAAAVTEVVVSGEDEDDKASEFSAYDHVDDDDDDISSEFGDLAMVDPVPMDDFDYGLM
jgi:hypothetical protein